MDKKIQHDSTGYRACYWIVIATMSTQSQNSRLWMRFYGFLNREDGVMDKGQSATLVQRIFPGRKVHMHLFMLSLNVKKMCWHAFIYRIWSHTECTNATVNWLICVVFGVCESPMLQDQLDKNCQKRMWQVAAGRGVNIGKSSHWH